MKTKLILALIFSISLASQADEKKPAPPASAPPKPNQNSNIEIIHDVEIGKGGDSILHAEIARPKTPSEKPMPAVIWIHGGGWSGGSHKGNPAAALASKGYFTASIEYRLSGGAKWPAQIEDCKLAVRWLRANAAKYNINPDRIGVWGSSAGGHLVACLGTMGGEAQFEGHGGYEGVSSRVQAVCDFCGPADFNEGSSGIQGATSERDAPGPLGLFGAPFKVKPEAWKQGSPVNYVKADAPPFLIVHGDADKTVPHAQSEHLKAALKKAGVSVELLTVKGGGHNMSAAPGEPTAEPNAKSIAETVAIFFDKHLNK